MHLDEVIRRYLLDCRRRGLSEHTQRNYRDMLTDLFRTLGNRPITNITLEDLRSWIDGKYDRGLSRHSIWSAVVIVRAFFNWCVSEGILRVSPARRLKPPRLPRPQPKALEEEDIQRLLQAARSGKHPERDEAILLFMLETGARLGAVANLKMDGFLLDKGLARTWTKGQKEVWLFFDQPHTKEALRRWLAVRNPEKFPAKAPKDSVFGLTPEGLRMVFRRLKKRAGLRRRFSPHILRHTSAVMRVEQGVDPSTLQQIMGWEDIRMAEVYTRMARHRIKRLAQASSPVAALFRQGNREEKDDEQQCSS